MEISDPSQGTPLARNHFLQVLLVLYLGLWTLAAFEPVSRKTWLLENLLVVGVAILLVSTHRRFVFSRFSYALIFVFLLLHVVGSHYTYSEVPAGAWVEELLGMPRNPYDRFVHFSFGLLLAYPARELVLRLMHARGLWGYLVPVLIIVSLSSVYEMVESWAARITNPELGLAFVGAQGDVWDGQKDMALALQGAILAMVLTALYRRRGRGEPCERFP